MGLPLQKGKMNPLVLLNQKQLFPSNLTASQNRTQKYLCVCVCVGARARARSIVSDFLQPHLLQPTRLLSPWNFCPSDKNTGVGGHFLLQGIFPTQGLNPCLLGFLHWQADQILYHMPPGKQEYKNIQHPSNKIKFLISWIQTNSTQNAKKQKI